MKSEDVINAFTAHYTSGGWSGSIGGSMFPHSGPGSSVEASKPFSGNLLHIVEKYNIKSVADCGCGDLEWMNLLLPYLNLDFYLGIDAAKQVVERHQKYHATSSILFVNDDIINLGYHLEKPVDLIICRQVLEHLPLYYGVKFIEEAKKWGKYLIVGTFQDVRKNPKGKLNGTVKYNLEVEPFNLVPVSKFSDSKVPLTKNSYCCMLVEL